MAQEKTKLVFGTATPGGGFPAYGWPYAEVLNAADATLGIEPVNTKGSTENLPLLEQDKLGLSVQVAPARGDRYFIARARHRHAAPDVLGQVCAARQQS